MLSRRCNHCGVNWPDLMSFRQCPGCDRFTMSADETPLAAGPAAELKLKFAADRAASKAKHDEFERYCSLRDELVAQELIRALDLLPTAAVDH